MSYTALTLRRWTSGVHWSTTETARAGVQSSGTAAKGSRDNVRRKTFEKALVFRTRTCRAHNMCTLPDGWTKCIELHRFEFATFGRSRALYGFLLGVEVCIGFCCEAWQAEELYPSLQSQLEIEWMQNDFSTLGPIQPIRPTKISTFSKCHRCGVSSASWTAALCNSILNRL